VAYLKPFKAVYYNPEKISDLSQVVCPPYDVISPEAQERYSKLSPLNFVHILFGKDTPGEDKYSRAEKYFKGWQKEKIMIQDRVPAMYFYSHQYMIRGETRTRLGFISLLRLHDNKSGIYRHEHTRLEPKEDRLRLLRQVKANLSPIFAIFLDKKRIIQEVYRHYCLEKIPFIDVVDEEKSVHKLWRIDDPSVVAKVQEKMQGEDIFIADGHHRYEVACAYRDEVSARMKGLTLTGEEDFNYLMAYFTNTDARGLTILPIHRLLKLDFSDRFEGFLRALTEYFDLEEVKERGRFFFLMEKGGRTEHLLGMYKENRFWLLRLKNIKILDKMMQDKPREYRFLDVSILNQIVFTQLLGLDAVNKSLYFSPHAEELMRQVDGDPTLLAFFLNSVTIQQIVGVALQGERMPAKSTYFHPKVLSGLVMNKFNEEHTVR